MLSAMRNRLGFTLIELMIVVVIIGILASMAIPRFMKAAAKSRQSEAQLILKEIYVNERAYRQQSAVNSYFQPAGVASAVNSTVLHPIWVDIAASSKYTYTIVATPNTFTATAEGNVDDDATLDTWVMDETGTLTNTINDVVM
jgi:prepilin-type N-terminal cleavage/methylation domain-containing protein